jgi:hypothetical protein
VGAGPGGQGLLGRFQPAQHDHGQGWGGWILGVGRLKDTNRLRPHERWPTIQHRQQLGGELDWEPAGQPDQLAAGGTSPRRNSANSAHSPAAAAASSSPRRGPGRPWGSTGGGRELP